MGARVWVATYSTRDGGRTRKVLGPAWVRDTGRKRARGAAVWRAADGTCPEGFLTPKGAYDALDVLLATERSKPVRRPRAKTRTLGQTLDAWLEHLELQGGRRGLLSPGTVQDYRSITRTLKQLLGEDTPLQRITPTMVRAAQERLASFPAAGRDGQPLGESRRRQLMQRLRQAFEFAVGRGWIEHNPSRLIALPAEPRPEPDFNVLEPSQVEAVARAVKSLPDRDRPLMRNGEIYLSLQSSMERRRALYADAVRISAYTGLRVGELRALRWRDVDFTGQALRVSRNNPSSAPAGVGDRAPKSGRGRAVPLIPDAFAALDRVGRLGFPIGPRTSSSAPRAAA